MTSIFHARKSMATPEQPAISDNDRVYRKVRMGTARVGISIKSNEVPENKGIFEINLCALKRVYSHLVPHFTEIST
jgi:hypothetical protein